MPRRLLRLSMRRVLSAPAAVFLELEAVRMRPPILRRRVVPALTGGAGERDDVAHALLRDLRDHTRPHRPPPLPARAPPPPPPPDPHNHLHPHPPPAPHPPPPPPPAPRPHPPPVLRPPTKPHPPP